MINKSRKIFYLIILLCLTTTICSCNKTKDSDTLLESLEGTPDKEASSNPLPTEIPESSSNQMVYYPNVLVDGFDESDYEGIIKGVKKMESIYNFMAGYYPEPWDLWNQINKFRYEEDYSFYEVEFSENSIYVCGYYQDYRLFVNPDDIVWCFFSRDDEVLNTFNNLPLCKIYQVTSGVVVDDLLQDDLKMNKIFYYKFIQSEINYDGKVEIGPSFMVSGNYVMCLYDNCNEYNHYFVDGHFYRNRYELIQRDGEKYFKHRNFIGDEAYHLEYLFERYYDDLITMFETSDSYYDETTECYYGLFKVQDFANFLKTLPKQ